MSTPSLLITPERFQLVLGVNEDCSVELNNVGYEAIIFRLLTTSPDRYIVRHTKGVIRGNSSMRATIALNRNYKFEEENKNGVKVVKDDFRIEYTLLGENDVIEAKFNNVPALIKEKKNESPASVLKKMIRCHLLLDPNASDASTARDDKKTIPSITPPTRKSTTTIIIIIIRSRRVARHSSWNPKHSMQKTCARRREERYKKHPNQRRKDLG
ncbi:MSP (Major sperm protein) domain containing protein, putative [Angomonas deanei]|uniref:MSP (Major sperm protein) domain containing protein, putative n=1 Tax=Angomonas deanei TaxID=59799 RepID=A0A7G2CND2_9TRYP|nr:MSP (Major sperm protein) domain containing protein, putative [Angomonas deanei]